MSSRVFSATGISGEHNLDVLNHRCNAQRPVLLSHKVWQGGQEVQQGRVQVGIPHPVLCFHLIYYGLGKWAGQPLKISTVGPGKMKTMTVWDHCSGCSFLVDCGAEESVFPASATDKRHRASSVPLVAANGTLIKTWDKCEASLVLGKGHTFTQEFHMADVTDSILGADFFASNRLAINMSNKCLTSFDNLHVVATGVASICSTICGL